MKTKNKLVLITMLLFLSQVLFAQESIESQKKNQSDFPCPVETPYYLNPPDGTNNAPIRDVILDWVNGAGTIYVELWFGIAANVLKVYDGPAISSYSLLLLNYDTTYEWFIVCKNDTCGMQSNTNSFLTIEKATGYFSEPFTDFGNWTIVGPVGTANWSIVNSNFSGGNAPELRMTWTPSFVGESKIRSSVVPLSDNSYTSYWFKLFFDWYANPSGVVTFGVTYDGGLTSDIIYSLVDPTGNVGPTIVSGYFNTPSTGSHNAQIEITFDGYSFNIDNIYWDDIWINQCLACGPPDAPTNLTSQVIFNPNPQVQLNWQDNSWDENGFRLFRKKGYPGSPTNYILVGVTPGNFTQVVDSTVLPESTYTYKVTSFNLYGENTSNTSTITVSVPVGIEEITNEKLPQEFALHQNYPNPFNPSTKIKYTIPASSLNPFSKGEGTFVTLKVYDILGNEVATLVNEAQAPGVYEVEFDVSSSFRLVPAGRSPDGLVRNLTSGIYFYQIKADSYIETKKMILLK